MYHKLKLKNICKYQHKINQYKGLIKLRDDLELNIKKSLYNLLNTPRIPHTDKMFFETKMTKRMGWWWLKCNYTGKWSKYKKLCRY